ncbi:MAG: PilZ domain-containing protein [Acidimicrobiales bacterium]
MLAEEDSRTGRKGAFPRPYVPGMSKNMPQVGQRVEVRAIGRPDHFFDSVVVSQDAHDHTIAIVMPTSADGLHVADGMQMTLGWTSDSGYHWVEVEASLDRSSADLLTVGPVGSIEIIDRRMYLRSAALFKTGLTSPDSDTSIATVLDLSEGGMRCVMERGKWPAVHERIHLRFQLEDRWIDQSGEVAWRNDRDDLCELGITFSKARERDASAIRRYVFSLQIKSARVEQ